MMADPFPVAIAVDAAVATMKQELGSHFDPECMAAFLRGLDAILQVRDRFRDRERTRRPIEVSYRPA